MLSYKHSLDKCLVCFVSAYVVAGSCLASSMGWNDNFNSFTNTQQLNTFNGWSAPTSVTAQTNEHYGTANLLGARIPENVSLTNLFGVTTSKVWTDMYAKPIVGDGNPVIATNEAVVFYFNASSNPVVYNGTSDSWVTISNKTINPSSWMRITVFQDFLNQKWTLFLDGSLIRTDLGFASTGTVSSFGSFAVEHSGTTNTAAAYLDNMWVYSSRPDGSTYNANSSLDTVPGGDSDSDHMADSWELDYFYAISRPGGRDYDGDGVSDDEEYADSTNPTNALSFLRDMPYREGLEAAVAGTLSASGWHGLVPGGTGTVTVQASDRIEYAKALSMVGTTSTTVNVTLSLTDSDATNVWCQVYAKPAFFDSDPTSTNDTVAFYVRTGGTIRALSGDSWTNLMTGVPSNTWLGFAVHLDYVHSNWDLYVSTNGTYGSSMVKANVGFAMSLSTNSKANFTNLVIETASTSYVDAVAVSPAYTNCVIGYTNVLASDRLAGQVNLVGIPPYDYAGVENTLAGQLGADLYREIRNDDRARVFYTNGWNVYQFNAGDWTMISGLAEASLPLTAAMGVLIDRLGGMDAVAFYPYGSVPVSYSDKTIYGADDSVAHGWNLLAWPRAPRSANSTGNWGFSGGVAGAGDRILLYENFTYRELYWKASDGTWKESGGNSSYVLKPGQAFWYYHAANATTTWPVKTMP